MGNEDAAQRRLAAIDDLPLLDLTLDVDELAETIMASSLIPEKASRDAIHIAVACIHNIDFLIDVELQTYCKGNDFERFAADYC